MAKKQPKKMGRPTDSPKIHETRIRMSDEDMERLTYCTDKLNKTKADVIRLGIEMVYAKTQK